MFRHRKGVREAEAAGEAGNLASAALASELCARVRAGTGQTEARREVQKGRGSSGAVTSTELSP